ncbi:MAG TPA: uroporphyrinogen-III C-methyltransferase, partial [Candidatus Omnitrophota bacterium]|nr:uroporphyrinogen-III C-methyltransferase [Candidatus Omnitrophota bacterium]
MAVRPKKIGMVSLVGAGPGDPGLLTLKAQRLLQRADLVVYDTLANPAHLRHVRPGVSTVCVGKGFRHHPFSQEKINRLIMKAARSGKNVVRLKGGDPFLFGRGGEEALYVRDHGIPFQVVPGVTSASACAAYAGVPLTHREHNSSVTFLTGHRAHDEDLDTVQWRRIVEIGGTIAIYMGFYNLAKIAKKLIQNGLSPKTPVSVIQWGTMPRQRSCRGTLLDIDKKVRAAKLGAPCMILVGDVVRLGDKLNWYEKLPLFGKTIVVTRMREKAGVLREKLEELGAEVLEFPVIEIKAPKSFAPMDAAIRDLKKYDWIVFASAYGADAFFGRLRQKFNKDARFLGKIKVACVGPETARLIERHGVRADLCPSRFESLAIAKEFKRRFGRLEGQKILFLRAQIAPREAETDLKKLGARVDRVTAY